MKCLVLLMSSIGPLLAADATGTILGTVADPSHLAIVGAQIAVTDLDTGAVRKVITNEQGEYVVPLLPPGLYQVQAEFAKFREAVFSGVKVNVNETVRADVELQLGERRETINVTSAVPLLQADTSTLGQVIDRSKVTELPLNERNFLSFMLLVPGVQMPADGSQTSRTGGAVSVNGAREQANNFLLDGVDNNDSGTNQFSLLPSVEAIEEFKVESSVATAEFGRNGGAQINVVLKSGTNQLHGSVFEFLRNRNMDARNFFDPPGDIPRYDRNQFGAALGGPIRRNKTFFMLSYEALRLREATTREATVPSQAERAAALAAVPVAQRNPAGVAVFDLYPAANVGPNLSTSNRFVATPLIRNSVNQGLVKLDHHISESDTVSGHYGITDEDRFLPYELANPYTNLPGFGTIKPVQGQNAGLDWVHIFSPWLINSARMGFNRRSAAAFQQNTGTSVSQKLGFPDVLTDPKDLGYPNVLIAGYDPIGESITLPQDVITNTFQYIDNVVWNPDLNGRRHLFKFGADIRRIQSNFYLDIMARGQWFFLGGITGPPLVDLLRGIPQYAIAPKGDSLTAYRTTNQGYYFQDDVRLRRGLTLNLGLRYEYNSPPVDIRNRLSVPNLAIRGPCTPYPDCVFTIAGTQGAPRGVYSPDRNNLAPRAGFAWQPFGSHAPVFRGGYGIFYDVGILNTNVLPRLNPPFFAIQVFPNTGTGNIQNILTQPGFIPPPLTGMIAPNLRTAYIQQWNFNIQYEPLRDLVVEAAYVGSKGTALTSRRDLNQSRPGSSGPPYPAFGPIQTAGSFASSTYNSFQLRVEKRLSAGLSVLGAYTWSKSIDDASSVFESATEPAYPQDSQNLKAERALSNFNSAHRLVVTGLYDVPYRKVGSLRHVLGDWHVQLIGTMQTGHPFTINRGVDQSGTGTTLGFFDRPDQIADPFQAGPVAANPDPACRTTISQGGRAPSEVRTAQAWFNPCAFAAPSTQRFGTAGRNSVIGPGLINWDVSLRKDLPIREHQRVELRVEFFNIANHPNFDSPNRNFDSPSFAAVQSQNAYGQKPPRQIQLGVRYVF